MIQQLKRIAAPVAWLTCACATLAQPLVLPPLDLDFLDKDHLSTRLAVEVKGFCFEGNTLFSDAQLLAAEMPDQPHLAPLQQPRVVADYIGRVVTGGDLEDVRRALTLLYVNKGYVNSGVVLPDQKVTGGVIRFKVIEGVLSDIRIRGNSQLRTSYLRDRIELGGAAPLNVNTLKDQLEQLRRNPNLKRINAELAPGASPGESLLDVAVEETEPFHAGLRFDNRRSPSIGAERFDLLLSHTNLTGHSDSLDVDYGITRNGLDDIEFGGVDNISIAYVTPVTAYDTTVELAYARSDALVIEAPFDQLDITSHTQSFAIKIRHPLYRTPNAELAVAAAVERRENETFLLGEPFSFSPGAQNGRSNVTVLRLSQEWLTRDQNRALAARSTFTFGLDLLNPTIGGQADGRFFAWLGQFQYVQRLWDTDNQAILRLSTQVADQRLLSLEQFAVGGFDTVRGYRENQIVRDDGVVFSAEFRIPLIRDASGRATLSLAPFVDVGAGWNNRGQSDTQDLSSVGIGVLFNPNAKFNVQFYWGYPFRDFATSNDNLQDLGIHFNVEVFAF